jgi:hypothetical protein
VLFLWTLAIAFYVVAAVMSVWRWRRFSPAQARVAVYRTIADELRRERRWLALGTRRWKRNANGN